MINRIKMNKPFNTYTTATKLAPTTRALELDKPADGGIHPDTRT